MLNRLCPVCLLLLLGSVNAQDCSASPELPKTVFPPIHDVRFLNDELLDKSVESSLAQGLRLKAWPENFTPKFAVRAMGSLAEEAAAFVRIYYQDHGYFKAVVAAKGVPSAADQSQYDIVVDIRSVGKQYRLGDLNFKHVTAFPEAQLRDRFEMRRGDVFNRFGMSFGLEKLRQLYVANGYINFTPVPNTEFDDENERADLSIDVDEGKQFRLRNVVIVGLNPEEKQRVLDLIELRSGDIFDSLLWNQSYAKISDLARRNFPPYEDKRLDEKNGTLDVVLDFRKARMCPVAGTSCQ